MTDREYVLVLKLRDYATAGLSKVSRHSKAVTTQMTGHFRKLTDNMKKYWAYTTFYMQNMMGKAAAFIKQHWIKIAAAVAAVGYVAKKMIGEFAKYQTALVDMGKVTSRSLEIINKAIKALPALLGKQTALMKGYYQVISAGVKKPKAAMDLLTEASKAGLAAHVGQAEMIKGLTKVMAGYAGEIKKVSTAADLLFAIEKEGQTTVAELVPVIGGLAKMSHEAGVNIDEMGGALALITQTAGDTAEAATQYEMLMMALIKPMDTMKKTTKALGYESGITMVKELGLADALKKLTDYMRENKIAMGDLFESKRGLLAMLSLMSNDYTTFAEKIEEVSKKTDMAKKAFEEWSVTFAATSQMFENTIGKAMIEFGTKIAPDVQRSLEDMGEAIENNEREITALAQAVAILIGYFYQVTKITGSFLKETAKGGPILATVKVQLNAIKEVMENIIDRMRDAKKQNLLDWVVGKEEEFKKRVALMNALDFSVEKIVDKWANRPLPKNLLDIPEQLTKAQIKAIKLREQVEVEVNERIYELTHSEHEFKLAMLKKEVMEMAKTGAGGVEIVRYYNLAKQKLTDEHNVEIVKLAKERNEEIIELARVRNEEIAKIELELHNKILELTHSELEFKLEMLKQEVMAMANAGAEGLKVIQYYELEKAKLIKESHDELVEKQIKAYDKMATEWNSKVESMASTFKELIVEGLDGEFEDMADRIGKTFKSMLATMVTDWIASMFKMQENADLNVNVSGSGGGGIGGLLSNLGGGGGGLGGIFKGLGGYLGQGFFDKIKTGGLGSLLGGGNFVANLKKAGLGNLLKYGAAGYNYAASGAAQHTAIASMEGGAVMLANGEQIAASTTAAAAAQTTAASATQMAMNKVIQYIPVVGAAYGVYSTVKGAMHDPKKSGSGAGYGQAALTGAMVMGPIGAVIMAAIYGITSAITKSGKVRRERQRRASMLTEGYSAVHEHRDEFPSIQAMAGSQTSAMRSPTYMNYAMDLKNMPGGDFMFTVQEQATILHTLTETIGRDAPIVSSQVNMLTTSMGVMFDMIKTGSPESAKKMAEMAESMKKTMAQDILEAFDHGTKSLRNVRHELQNIGMEDAETKTKLYSSALAQLFNGTMPMGEVQIERLYEDMQKLKDEMDEAESVTKGMTILMTALANGLELSGEQLKLFRENAQNIAMMEHLDLYEAMGLEQIKLVPAEFDSVEKSIEGMRESLAKMEAQTESFSYWVEGLPDSLGELKDALIVTGYAMQAMNSVMKEMTDLIEDLTLLPELFRDFQDAIDANDLGAYIDTLGTLQLYLNDLVEVITMLSVAVPSLQGLSFAVMGLSVAIQAVVLAVQGLQIVLMGLKAAFSWFDSLAEINDKVKEWTQLKTIIMDAIIAPVLLALQVLSLIPGAVGKMFQNILDGVIAWKNDLLSETEATWADLEEWYKAMRALNSQTFNAMTIDIMNFFDNFGKTGFELGLEDMKKGWEAYFDYLSENWQDWIDNNEYGSETEALLEEMRDNAKEYYEKMINDFYKGFIAPFKEFRNEIDRALQGMTDEGRTAEDIKTDEARVGMQMWGAYAEGDYEEWLSHAQEMKGLIQERYDLEKARLEEIEAQLKQIEAIQKSIKLDLQEVAGGRTGADVFVDMQEAYGAMIDAAQEGDMTEALNQADELRGLIMERYRLEKEKILDLKDSILDLADQIDTLKDKQKDWSQSIQDMMDEISGDKGEGAEQLTFWNEKIASLQSELGGAETLEERERILEQLRGAYQSKMGVAGELKGEIGAEAYQMIVDSIVAGLKELQGQGEGVYQGEIDTKQAELDTQLKELGALTGIEGLTVEMLRGENANEILLAKLNADTTSQLTWLNGLMDGAKTTLEGLREEQLAKLELIRLKMVHLGTLTQGVIDELDLQRIAAIKDMKEYFDNKFFPKFENLDDIPGIGTEIGLTASNTAAIKTYSSWTANNTWDIRNKISDFLSSAGSRQFGGAVRDEGMYHLHGGEDVATPNFQSNVMNRLERIEAKQAVNGGSDVYLVNAGPIPLSKTQWKEVAKKVLPLAKEMPREKLFYDKQVMKWDKGT